MMNASVWAVMGVPHADIVVFNKGSRDFRLERLTRGEEVPREFFYGFFELERAGLSAVMTPTADTVPGTVGTIADRVERMFAAITSLGVRPWSVRLAAEVLDGRKVAISYTDGYSLSLGLGTPRSRGTILIGGFHGISDIENRAPALARPLVHALIRRSLAGLDHVFFFGPADRQQAIERYGLTAERSSIIAFGVDTEFWRPLPEPKADFVVAIGQDRNRDYDLLAAAPTSIPVRIVTRQPVVVPLGANHVQLTVGDFFESDSLSDEELRRLYNIARAVVVPLKDVYQPSGYSVTLQAMSCGRPVILTNTKGLWIEGVLKDGENCLLVPPGDRAALAGAIDRIAADPDFAERLGRAARATALAEFGLDRLDAATRELAQRGLALWSQRARDSRR